MKAEAVGISNDSGIGERAESVVISLLRSNLHRMHEWSSGFGQPTSVVNRINFVDYPKGGLGYTYGA